jgi:hypothetical protein
MLTFENYPTGMAILCERPDPGGGGQTLLSSVDNIETALSNEERRLLNQPLFSYWKDEGLINVGEHLDEFAVLPSSAAQRVRFTSKFLSRFEQLSPPVEEPVALALTAAIEKAIAVLEAKATRLTLRYGQAVLFSQLHWCHGRTALKEVGPAGSQGAGRKLWRMYYNYASRPEQGRPRV